MKDHIFLCLMIMIDFDRPRIEEIMILKYIFHMYNFNMDTLVTIYIIDTDLTLTASWGRLLNSRPGA